jgi:hypothetical protein
MLIEKVEMLEKKLLLLRRDAEKFDNGNASAGTRVRKDLMDLVKEIKEVRQLVLEKKKSRYVVLPEGV